MVNFPIKSLATFLQIRYLVTKATKSIIQPDVATFVLMSEIAAPTLQPVVKSEAFIQKSQRKEKAVITLLKRHHFSDAQIANLAIRLPSLLRAEVKSNLGPKFKFFIDNGFVGTYLIDVIFKNPLALRHSLSRTLIPNVSYLRELVNNDQAALLLAVKRSPWLVTLKLKQIVQPNIDFLLEEGMGMDTILKQFTTQPRTLTYSVDRTRSAVETIKKFGMKPSENMFTYGLRIALSMNESVWNRKVELLKSLGWSDEAIKRTIAHYPLCFSQSEDKIKSIFHFLVEDMGLKPNYVMSCPKLLMYSLTKRIMPRCKVAMTLKEKKLLKDFRLPRLINMPEKEFTTRFILNYPSLASDLRQIYRGNEKVDEIAVQ